MIRPSQRVYQSQPLGRPLLGPSVSDFAPGVHIRPERDGWSWCVPRLVAARVVAEEREHGLVLAVVPARPGGRAGGSSTRARRDPHRGAGTPIRRAHLEVFGRVALRVQVGDTH